MKPATFAVLRSLSDGDYHSGTGLGQALHISRASVSHALRDLEQYGLVIHRVRGRGYRWLNPIQWLDIDQIQHHLDEMADEFQVEVLDTTESTNSLLLQRAVEHDFPDKRCKQVVVAELQTGGRGRRGRSWLSGLGDSLTFSLLWPSQCTVHALSGLSLAVGLAIVRALTRIGVQGVVLKWPNDVLFAARKLAGVLIELHGDMLSPSTVIIGVGLNLKLSGGIRNRIDQAVTDVAGITDHMPDRNRLLALLLRELKAVLDVFEQQGFQPFQEEWMRYHAYQNRLVQVDFPDGSVKHGIANGVTPNGALQLNTPAGMLHLNSGEVSLRGVA
ncbi:biotin--[acetyl-CoA-carboxylase] ligase [Nitrosomonas sp. ANs5]|uniref:biotin--[acetyl-CoA-carboxylase] ligase n=1 Tax=Nitrosomonas sp. ANs5 TaxID=3423941 RepID=UPI003D32894C